ncbi:hypothetical protein ON010_g5019 [Phytophthora cinnamomi]|nr:hypothetical protein ON010_g5019 [Phytophthora cinnamomi]
MASRLSRPLVNRISASSAAAVRIPGGSSGLFASRGFANAARNPDEALKADFKRWFKKEVVLLACMVAAGATGVHFYQGDRKQALKHCLHAYDVIKSTNPHDRHLFELAFSIAAQYETLSKGTPATNYYLDALEHNSRELKPAKRERNRVVTLDRIAQSYEDRSQHNMKAKDGEASGEAMATVTPTPVKPAAAAGKKKEKGKTAVPKPPRGTTKAWKMAPIFWREERGKSSPQVVL